MVAFSNRQREGTPDPGVRVGPLLGEEGKEWIVAQGRVVV